ncbi:hypothetical protein PHYSODRAFT_292980 [Phytophthora sojae]|uniref:Uncharacterized protein n=1 Tax=Phytophthora sojae (strain P6497) TaxID=1094619 RepID=G4YP52_PHYSP|nr:hypothetical protein PHYSODRAFT_292979 [Phytophthora sojae]XP_009514036.1 hypothetical protein PHYSODRAFT_292980 [Phytophthora sojae]EGZ26760.1 hypothetical protein PHYSODRAFT_292979 [Phytophthora sojae]EGZ26761.1 hypothetical protein PHYSODRAFT_292980 [Phytophthora sojae]|eukprot:XP_009514035.1 hypothetical protein PHYSODRAFT_292979 [Phytophthora sojae]
MYNASLTCNHGEYYVCQNGIYTHKVNPTQSPLSNDYHSHSPCLRYASEVYNPATFETHDKTVEDEDYSEESGITSEQMEKLKKCATGKVIIDWAKARSNSICLQTRAEFPVYMD